MWRREESQTQGVAGISTTSSPKSTATPPSTLQSFPESGSSPDSSRAVACIGEGIKIRGEITGSENLVVNGDVEGKLEINSASVTVGPNGRVKAGVSAREVIVQGSIEGRVDAEERVQICSTGRVIGDVATARVAIEEGAVVRGKIEAGKRNEKVALTSSRVASGVQVQEQKKDAVVVASHSLAD